MVREENEGDIVGLVGKVSLQDYKGTEATYSLECNINLGSISNGAWENRHIFGRVNWRLAVFGGNDNKCLFVYFLLDQFGNDLSKRIVDEVDCPKQVRREVQTTRNIAFCLLAHREGSS